MFVTPVSLMLLTLAEYTFFDAAKLYLFLQQHTTDGTFHANMLGPSPSDETRDKVLKHLVANPELVLAKRPSAGVATFAITCALADIPKGLTYHQSDEEEAHDVAVVFVVDSVLTGMEAQHDGDPIAIACDLWQDMCEEVVRNWINNNYSPFESQAIH